MLSLIANLTFRLLLCAVMTYLAWRQADVIGLVFSSLVFGLALSSPVLELMTHFSSHIRHRAFSKVNGRHYVFQTISIDIIEDENQQCWLRLADVRKVIEGFPRDSVIVKLYPDEFMIDKKLGGTRIGAKALVNYLQNSSNVTAMKFKLWIEREVIFPRKTRRA
jgi:hypothetical protein